MFDVCIIGAGGIVGCAIARELAMKGFSVAAIEQHGSLCQEASGHNSRVVHSGFHEKPGTLKAQLAREGSGLMIRYAEDNGVRLLNCGMLIAVPHGSIRGGLWKDIDALWRLWRQGQRHNLSFHFIFTSRGVARLAPIRAMAGIFIPSVAVIDVEQFLTYVERDARSAGAQFYYETQVTSIGADGASYVINDFVRARCIVNSSGLQAHRISALAGGPKYEIEFIRGDYYELIGGIARWNIRTLIYPAMPPRSPSKGVHLGPRTDGRLYIGPSSTPAPQPASKEIFLTGARQFLPDVQDDDLRWAYAGIRPKHASADFIIRLDRTSPGLVNLIGIDSPGLSASLAIARYTARIVGQNLEQ